MNIAVFGANGATGRLLVQQALDAGHDVAAVTRRPSAFPLRARGLRVISRSSTTIALSARRSRSPRRQ